MSTQTSVPTTGPTTSPAHDLARRSLRLMEDWDDAFAATVVHPGCTNREAAQEPPAARGRGRAAMRATYDWLHDAYADLAWEVLDVVAEGDLVVAHVVMRGRHTGPFVVYDAQGHVERAFAPTGRTFATTQTHWFRVADGLMVEHWANRDDLGQAVELGWVPPSPAFLLRSALATRRARRTATA